MKTAVISLGGSIISGDPLDFELILSLSKKLQSMDDFDHLGIVVGGGKLARSYIEKLREFGINENILDEIGINATRMNALSIASFFENSNTKIPETVNEAAELMQIYKFVVMGGTEPGHTTDTVAALLAERINCKILINGTSVDGVYDMDPKKNPGAKKIGNIGYADAIALSSRSSKGAGPNVFMDITSLHIAMRSKITVFVINGRILPEYESILKHHTTDGTIIG
ncbi:MAG: UMP kinase [Thermoplasmataceae archaeon]|jgi:uridylate kinase